MAEKNDGWFNSWLTAAKNKSTEVLEFVKKDLEEFGNVVKNEASSVMSSTGSVIEKTLKLDSPESTASTVKKSFSTFLGQVNTALNPSPDDSDTEAVLIVDGSETVTLTKLQEAIYKLQTDENTFLLDPEAKFDQQYHCWLEILEDQLSESSLLKHLTNSVVLNNQYMKLVPEKVSHNLFWQRYLFKKALIEDDMARQEVLDKKKEKKQSDETNLKWDQEDFANDIELTEEEQIRLLEQYENETRQRKELVRKGSNEHIDDDVITVPNSKDSEIIDNKCDTDSEKVKPAAAAAGDIGVCKKVSALKMTKTESSSSLDTASNNSSDGDWEKIN